MLYTYFYIVQIIYLTYFSLPLDTIAGKVSKFKAVCPIVKLKNLIIWSSQNLLDFCSVFIYILGLSTRVIVLNSEVVYLKTYRTHNLKVWLMFYLKISVPIFLTLQTIYVDLAHIT